MRTGLFFNRVRAAMALGPVERHEALSRLHADALAEYLEAVDRITPERAVTLIPVSDDPRTYGQLIGHYIAWDRFSIMGAGDILAGVHQPRAVKDVKGYITPEGQMMDFDSVDAFNAYQAEQYANIAWDDIRCDTRDAAGTMYALFSQIITPKMLENTLPHRRKLDDGTVIDGTTMGWCLWLIEIQHIAIDHADELDYESESI
jgi:hypothetical protein